jgi:nucleotide-binding universal stress UspA family protein
MQAFQKILFPVDMSDSCLAAAPWVEAMAKKFNAGVTMLHVLEMPPAYATDWYGFMAMVDMSAIRDSRINELNSFLNDRFAGVTVSRVMLEGAPETVISSYAQEQGFDLVMMPTHGYGMFRSLLLGSVTAKVLHDTACPVWTGVHVEEVPAPSAKVENIMCAVDLTEKSLPTMKFASRLANDLGAKLWLVHAVPGADVRPEKYFDADLQEYLEAEATKTIQDMQTSAGIKAAGICLGAGDAARVVRDAAEHHSADLVIAGRGHATRVLGRLRTHVYSIIRESPCPVISV